MYFWLGPMYKLFKSHVNCALMGILRLLGPIQFCKGPMKISKGPFKFGNLHRFEWDMGHWPILRAHHHFLARIISDFDIQCNLPNCPLWSIFVQLNINQWEPHKDQLCKVCLNQTNSELYDAVWSKLLRMSKSQICRKYLKGKICKHFPFEYHRLNGL